jgi:DNA-binding response OmpR family regulator/two-component sensor histidine kinase
MLAALQASKTRFFQNVSHEFRTPLTLVLCGLDALSVAGSGPEAEQLQAARRAALRLDRLVDALLTFARAESGALVAQRETTDLVQLTGDAASMFRSAIEDADLEYLVELPQEPLVVDIDREMWSCIVVNLLSNAYKFTAHGRIRLRLGTSTDGVTLTVEDTGVGIERAALGRVFERFQQAHTSQVRSGPGAGIGLSLVADLVRAHHGNVDLMSESGVGSTFTVSLPLKTGPATGWAAASVDERIQAQTISDIAGVPDPQQGSTEAGVAALAAQDGAAQDTTAQDTAGRAVLLVEDNGDLRQYLVRLLEGNGWTVTAVPDAESALRHRNVPDVILTDVMLPGRDGLSLVRAVRADPALATVPVILLTARAGAEFAAEGLRAGADDYIVKPFNAEELVARLDVHHELACLRSYALAQAESQVANLETALTSNRRIGAAIGVLMASRRVTSQEAFALLRRVSNESNCKLRDVADRVVLTGSLDLVV